ncbi:MAG: PaaI family thioesterase [Alphaproteobacteria bacterium]|nr:PaaI family thioesterase [Alphaproteobacteria bacterium]
MSDAGDTTPKRTDAELLARFQNTANQPKGSVTLGFRMIAVDQGKMQIEAEFDARDDFRNPMGQIQGGYLCAMLDDVMSVACMVASGMTHVAPTLEMKTSFLRPALANGSKLRAVGRVVKWGRTIAFTEGEIRDAEGKLLAKATGTAMPTPFANFKKK